MRLGLPAWVLYFVYQHQRVKKKRQAEQEADTRKAFLEKHDVKSSE